MARRPCQLLTIDSAEILSFIEDNSNKTQSNASVNNIIFKRCLPEPEVYLIPTLSQTSVSFHLPYEYLPDMLHLMEDCVREAPSPGSKAHATCSCTAQSSLKPVVWVWFHTSLNIHTKPCCLSFSQTVVSPCLSPR